MKGILRFFALPLILLAFGISLNGCGGGSSSSDDAAAPGIPSNVSATSGDTKVTVSWNAVSGASSYTIYYATTPGVTKSAILKQENATSPCEISGLTNGIPYYFVVTAVVGSEESSESSEVSAIPNPKPKGSSAYSGNGEAVVYCQPVKNAASYNLYYSTSPGVTTNSYTGTIPGMTNPQTVTGLSNGTPYYFVITAVIDTNEGPISSEATATPSAMQPQSPPSPAGVTVTGGPASVTVKWYTSYSATSYNIYYTASASITTANLILTTPINVPADPFGVAATQSHTINGLTAGTTYSFVVTAVNATVESDGQETPKTTTPL